MGQQVVCIFKGNHILEPLNLFEANYFERKKKLSTKAAIICLTCSFNLKIMSNIGIFGEDYFCNLLSVIFPWNGVSDHSLQHVKDYKSKPIILTENSNR